MISRHALRIVATTRSPLVVTLRERNLAESHLEAWDEIDRLRSGMEAMLAALDHNDAGEHEKALEQIEKLSRLT